MEQLFSLIGFKDTFSGDFPATAVGWASSLLYNDAVSARQNKVNSQGWNPGQTINNIEHPNRSYTKNVAAQTGLKAFGKVSGLATIFGTAWEAGAYTGCFFRTL